MVAGRGWGRELRTGRWWVITPPSWCGPALAALRDGARTVALHLLRSRVSADLETVVESEAVLLSSGRCGRRGDGSQPARLAVRWW